MKTWDEQAVVGPVSFSGRNSNCKFLVFCVEFQREV